MTATFGWGRMVNRWHDETGPYHALKADNSPACGASYFASSGSTREPTGPKCKRCEAIVAKAARAAKVKRPTKYVYEYIVQGNYGAGWDDLTAHDTRKAARAERRVYDANESYPHRVIYRRTLRTVAP